MGRKRHTIGPIERATLLLALRHGAGRMAACRRAGVAWSLFRRRLRDDPALRAAVQDAEGAGDDSLMEMVFAIATSHPDPAIHLKAATNFLARRDRLRASALARRERAGLRKALASPGSGADAGLIPLLMGILREVVPPDEHGRVLERLEAAAAGRSGGGMSEGRGGPGGPSAAFAARGPGASGTTGSAEARRPEGGGPDSPDPVGSAGR